MTWTQYDYDSENRTLEFAKRVRIFVKRLSITTANIEDSKQLIKSSGSVGANYIEANEAFSKKDFYHRIKISRKESKESGYWLKLVFISEDQKELENGKKRFNSRSNRINENILFHCYKKG